MPVREAARGAPYATIMRLRPDLAWELSVMAPPPTPRTVYVPLMEQQGGVNDHLAWGARAAMGAYLGRLRHVARAPELAAELHAKHGKHVVLREIAGDAAGSEERRVAAMRCTGRHTPRLRGSLR